MERRILIFIVLMFLLFSIFSYKCLALIVDHQSVDGFSQLSDTEISQAATTGIMVRHASVGANINDGLDNLASQNSKFNRDNWSFQDRGNPGWEAKVDDFVTQTAAQINSFDIFAMKFCYIDQDADWIYYRDKMLELESRYPNKKFAWWTMPIMTEGNSSRDDFNNQVRNYCSQNNKILFDIADIESHNPNGLKQTDSDGTEKLYSGYTSDGGHLNNTGALRVAKAFWWLMAKANSTPTTGKAGDLNSDNVVDIIDLVIVGSNFGKDYNNVNTDKRADANGDKVIDIVDLVMVGSNFGK